MQQKTSQLGTIGELLVMVKLTQKGWTALNANASVKNIARYDILCAKDEKNVTFIQVKTTKETTFPVGISIGKAKDKSFLNEHIIGPWVFVRQIGDGSAVHWRTTSCTQFPPLVATISKNITMPSSSRAYPLSLDKKAASYRRMFEAIGLL